MPVYLARHGKAEAGPVDDVRPISRRGRQDIELVAGLMRSSGVRLNRILHSPLTRAVQTAEIFARALDAPMCALTNLRYDGDIHTVRDLIWHSADESLMLVGHNPFMEHLSTLLLTDDAGHTVLTFYTATVARLTATGPHGRFTCDWITNSRMRSSEPKSKV